MNDKNSPQEMICICCPLGCVMQVVVTPEFAVTGNRCPRGKKYAAAEITAPKRTLTSTVKIAGGLHPVIPVKTVAPIPKEKIFAAMDILSTIEVVAPIRVGAIIVENIVGTGVNVVATKNIG